MWSKWLVAGSLFGLSILSVACDGGDDNQDNTLDAQTSDVSGDVADTSGGEQDSSSPSPDGDATHEEDIAEDTSSDGGGEPDVYTGPTATDITAGALHSCAVSGGDVECWGCGSDAREDEDDGYRYDKDQAVPPRRGTFKQVSAGKYHTCALTVDDTVQCWGINDGLDDFDQTNPPSGTFQALSAGSFHNCALTNDGDIQCWGLGSDADADEDGLDDDDHDQAVPPEGTYQQVSAGGFHTCAVATDGSIDCWGYNGTGGAEPPVGTFESVSCGNAYSCAIATDGTIACWGSMNYELPSGTFKELSTGKNHTCGIKTDNTLECFGLGSEPNNTNEGSEWNPYDYDFNQAVPPSGTFQQVDAGGLHTCGIRTSGEVECWGLGTERYEDEYDETRPFDHDQSIPGL